MDTEISQSEADFSDNLSTDVTLLSSSLAPTCKGQIFSSSPSDAGVQSDTRKTLYEVKKRLENLHLSLKNCTLRDWTVMAHTNSYQGCRNNGRGYNDLSSRKRKNNYANSIDLRKRIKKHNISNLIAMYAAYNAMILNRERPRDFSSYPSNDEHSLENSVSEKDDEFNIRELSKELSAYKNGVNKSILHSNVATGVKVMEMHKGDGDSECFSEKSASSKNNDKISVVSEKLSVDEISKESDSDDKSTSALLEEALRIKRELLSRIQLRKEYEAEIQESNADDKTDECTYWESIENPFEPKMLDMISEESSDSSSTNRRSKIDVYKTLEKCTSSQEIKINVNKKNHLEGDKSVVVSTENFSKSELPEIQTTIADDVNVNLLNDESQSLSNTGVQNVQKNSNSVFRTEVISKDNENQNIETLNLVNELNSSKLTESSSDTSVNRLIDRLIESERRSKSARSSSDTKSKRNLSMDSINNLIDSHKFIEPVQSDNESDSCSQSHSAEKYNNFESNNVDNLDCIQSLPSENTEDQKTSRETMLERAHDKGTEIDKKKINTIADVDTQNSETECAHTDSYNHEQMCENLEQNLQLKDNEMCTSSADEKTCVELLMFENNEFSRKQVPVDELINIKPLIEEINEKNNSSFHCSNDPPPEDQLIQENLSTISFDKLETIENKSLSSADDNLTAVQQNNYISSPRGDNLHYPTCIAPNSAHYSPSLRNAEHSVTKIQKNMNSIGVQKQSAKNITDFKSNRQIRAKSSLNLSSVEKHTLSPTFRRSRSYATPREISFNNKSNAKGEASFESLTSSSKSSSISHTPREHKDNDENHKLAELDETKKCPFESLAVSSKSTPKSHFETATVADKSTSEIKRNNSYKSLSSRSSKSHSMVFPGEPTENHNSKANIEGKNSFESLILLSKSSSKSCIPIFKNRLESTRKNISESRSSLIEEPLALDSYRRENEKLIAGLQSSNDHKQEAIVYMNVMDEHDKISSKVLNPEQFFDYIKNKEIELKSAINEDKINASIMDNNHLMILSNSKVTSSMPSTSENIDFTDVSSLDSSSCQLQNDQPQSWPCKADRKETEVLVKPSTLDISTSITDLPNTFFAVENNEVNELKIFEIPEELTKEEYITFLKVMNENPELRQLSNIEESCK